MSRSIRLIIANISGRFMTVKQISQQTGLTERDVKQGLYQIRASKIGFLSSKPGKHGGYSFNRIVTNAYYFTCTWNRNWRAANNLAGLSHLL